ncbi:unnamed protein product, partial [Penicillium pancosmium]
MAANRAAFRGQSIAQVIALATGPNIVHCIKWNIGNWQSREVGWDDWAAAVNREVVFFVVVGGRGLDGRTRAHGRLGGTLPFREGTRTRGDGVAGCMHGEFKLFVE